MKKVCDEVGMEMLYLHGPYDGLPYLWREGEGTERIMAELMDCVHACADNGIKMMVAHGMFGFGPLGYLDHQPTEFGLMNYGKVVREAAKLGVKIAFENVEGEEFLFALMERFRNEEHVGFCWDTGHQMCYNPTVDMMALYGDRLMMTHINDNLGVQDYDGRIIWRDDLHLLPFDGIGDWQEIASKIKKSGYQGMLNLELSRKNVPGRREKDVYEKMDPVDYLHQAYIRVCRLAALILRA